MKICFVGWADNIHLERWAGHFARRGEDVSVISFSGFGKLPSGVRQYRLGFENRGVRWKIVKLKYLLWKLRPDLVHVHWAHFAQPVAKAWSGPLVITAWGSDIYQVNEQAEAYALIEGLRAAHTITCDSEHLKARVEQLRGTNFNNVHCIQWGVDLKTFFPAPADARFVSEIGAIGRRVVFSPRAMLPIYNQYAVLSAFEKVLCKVPDALLVMKDTLHNPIWQKLIRKRLKDLRLADDVRIVGEIPYERMRELYRMAPVTISVPFSDATPMSVLEAMACGSVPLVSDLPSLREWVVDEWNGYIVSATDTEAMAKRIVHILTNPQTVAEFGHRNRKIIEDRADQVVHMERMNNIYCSILKNAVTRPIAETAWQFLMFLSLCFNAV